MPLALASGPRICPTSWDRHEGTGRDRPHEDSVAAPHEPDEVGELHHEVEARGGKHRDVALVHPLAQVLAHQGVGCTARLLLHAEGPHHRDTLEALLHEASDARLSLLDAQVEPTDAPTQQRRADGEGTARDEKQQREARGDEGHDGKHANHTHHHGDDGHGQRGKPARDHRHVGGEHAHEVAGMAGGAGLLTSEQGSEDGPAEGVVEISAGALGHVALRGAEPHLHDERHAEGDAGPCERGTVARRGRVDHVTHEQGIRDGNDGHGALQDAQAHNAPHLATER